MSKTSRWRKRPLSLPYPQDVEDWSLKDLRRHFFGTYLMDNPRRIDKTIISLFREWAESPRAEDRQKLFDVAIKHENQKFRKWACEQIRYRTPARYWNDYANWWIRNPSPELKELMNFVFHEKVDLLGGGDGKGVVSAGLILLDLEEEAEQIDPDYQELEALIRQDPLIFGPLDERLNQIRQREFNRAIGARSIVRNYTPQDTRVRAKSNRIPLPSRMGDLWRTLRSGDWALAWQIMLDGSFASIVENISWLARENWRPLLAEERRLFEELLEYVGEDGWALNEDLFYETLYTTHMDPVNFAEWGINCSLARKALIRPQSFQYHNTHSQIFLEDTYYDVNGTFHTSFAINGISAFQLAIPKATPIGSSQRSFQLATSFDVQVGDLALGISVDGVNAILRPASQSTSRELKWVQDKIKFHLHQKEESLASRKNLRLLYALEALLHFHAMRRFKLKRKVKRKASSNSSAASSRIKSSAESADTEDMKTPVSIGIDFGNSTTAITVINSDTLLPIPGSEIIVKGAEEIAYVREPGIYLPSVITYSSSDWRIGKPAEALWDRKYTFKEMKKSLRNGYRSVIRVQGRQILAPQAASDFINKLIGLLDREKFHVEQIGVAFPVSAPGEYQEWLVEAVAAAFQIDVEAVFRIDEASAATIGMRGKIDPYQPILTVDIGGGTSDITVLEFQKEDHSQIGATIYARGSHDLGGREIDKVIFCKLRDRSYQMRKKHAELDETKLLKDCQALKHRLSTSHARQKLELNPQTKQSVFISREQVNKWLDEERYYERLSRLITDTINEAKRSGARTIETILLVGGGCQWSPIQDLTRTIARDAKTMLNEYDPFAVSRGIAESALGLSVRAALPYDFGYVAITDRKETFNVLLKKGTPIPSEECLFEILPEDKIVEIAFDVMRHRITIAEDNETTLLFDSKGKPKLVLGKSFEYFEPLRAEITRIHTKTRNIGLYINEGAKVVLQVYKKGVLEHTMILGNAL